MKNNTYFKKSLAVLPFVNISRDVENEYFSDGITEEIINGLTNIKNLKVTSRTSSFYFKNKNIPIKQIAKQLGVDIILEGSVRFASGQVRITAQLIQADDDFHFWSESWDRNPENIFEVQDEISLLIADKLREQFGHFEYEDHLVQRKTEQTDAYNLWLKARFHFNRWNPEDVRKSIHLYEKAVEIDPRFTDAWVGLADAYSFMATTQFMPPAEAWSKCVEYTHKAYELNPENAGVHYLLANLSFFTDSNFADSFKHALKSVELKPSYAEAQQYMAFLYLLSGETENAHYHLQLALAIDPLNQETLFYKAYFFYRTGAYEKAMVIYEDLLQKNPNNIPAFVVHSYCMLFLNRFDELLPVIANAPDNILIPHEKLGILCLLYLLKGDKTNAEIHRRQLEKEAENQGAFQAHSYLFLAYANSNRFDSAFQLLEQSIKIKSPILLLSFSDPLVNGLVNDNRYKNYHQKLYGHFKPFESEPKKKPLLDKRTAKSYSDKLLYFISVEKPYLNPQVSLRSLASQVEIHPNQLSWLLNENIGKKFNEFINFYRLQHFIELAKNPENDNISIIGLAYESGFNSKTVFNTFFKKEMGITPVEYIKGKKE